MSADQPDLRQLEAELTAILQAQQQAEQQLDEMRLQEEGELQPTRDYPSSYIDTDSDVYKQVRDLWQRFGAWIDREGASSQLVLNTTPAPAAKLFAIQEELAQSDDLFDDLFTLPSDVLASFACHDGQAWSSTTGVLGRWYLLDCQTMFTEWRDQRDMMEMGLYSANKYTQARKAQPRHPRIDTSCWFNPRWIPIACSRGSNLGGDLICIDMAPVLSRHQGQVILYLTESAERIVLADSFAEWLNAIVGHLEAGVYRFDLERRTFAAGVDPQAAETAKEDTADNAAASSTSAAAAVVSSSSSPLPTSASATIGVEAFMFSSLESRDFFIRNQTEDLVYLAENDFGLLATDGLGGNIY